MNIYKYEFFLTLLCFNVEGCDYHPPLVLRCRRMSVSSKDVCFVEGLAASHAQEIQALGEQCASIVVRPGKHDLKKIATPNILQRNFLFVVF